MNRLLIGALIAALAVPSFAAAQPAPAPALGFVAAGGADFAGMRRAGATWVKLLADWSALEPVKGQFAWKSTDDAVAAATAAGLRVVLVLAYTPKWASYATGPELSNPSIYSRQPAKRAADWQAFVTAVVTRYKAKVQDWQVWTVLGLPAFRGTTSEYLTLLRGARVKSKAADAGSRIILSTPPGMDLAFIRRALTEAGSQFDAISLNPLGLSPDQFMRPMRVLRAQVLARQPKAVSVEWDPRTLGDRPRWPGQFVKAVVVGRTFGVGQVFWAAPPAADVESARKTFDERVGGKPFVGYLVRPGAVAIAFGEGPTSVVAWSVGAEAQLQVEASAAVYATMGEVRQQSAPGGDKILLRLTPDPVVVAEAGAALFGEARATLEARGLPLAPGERDYSEAGLVRATLGKANVEDGLYNMRFRGRKNGAVEVVEVDGSEAVRTNTSKDVVFIYFDVDDSFLFYVDDRAAVEIAVEVRGAAAPQQLGFNIFYDSMTGYRFTPWQWVEAKAGWVTYTFRLTDANFANTWGWDFAVNAVGNRKENLTVRTVTVRKVAR
ncbi:MAG: beta-galactosidase [bacterium]